MTESGDWMPALALLGAVWILGVWWGLWLAWTQPARMQRWATYAHRAQLRLNEIDYRAEGIETDDVVVDRAVDGVARHGGV